MNDIIIKVSLFKIVFTFLMFLLSFTALFITLIQGSISFFMAFATFITFLGLIYFAIIIIKGRNANIIFNKDGLMVYSLLTGKINYFIPINHIYGIYFKDKLPSAFNIVLLPNIYSDREYKKQLKEVILPEYIKNSPQNIPTVVLGQIHISLYFYAISLKKIKPLLDSYINNKP